MLLRRPMCGVAPRPVRACAAAQRRPGEGAGDPACGGEQQQGAGHVGSTHAPPLAQRVPGPRQLARLPQGPAARGSEGWPPRRGPAAPGQTSSCPVAAARSASRAGQGTSRGPWPRRSPPAGAVLYPAVLPARASRRTWVALSLQLPVKAVEAASRGAPSLGWLLGCVRLDSQSKAVDVVQSGGKELLI